MPKVNFKSAIEQKENKQKNNSPKVDLSVGDYYACLAIGVLCGIMTQRICTEDKAEKAMEQLQNKIDLNELKTDKLDITDVTGDKVPDIILESKDGTKIIYDAKQNTISSIE